GKNLIPLGGEVMRQRRRTASEGSLVATLVLDRRGWPAAPPQVTLIGLAESTAEPAAALRDALADALEGLPAPLRHDDNAVRDTRIELLGPLGPDSPVAGFLARNPAGGMHHVCYEVRDIIAARDRLRAAGARVLGDGEPQLGAHDKPVLFLHPKDFCGTLIEL